METIKKAFKILIAKKLYLKPPKQKLFIYDENTFRSGYASFFHENDCFVFDTRYKELYILLYIKAILKKIILLILFPIHENSVEDLLLFFILFFHQ